jgi:hypothetical protein
MFRPSEYEEMLRFEQKAYMQFEEPGNDGVDRTPEKSELLWDQIETDDAAFYDRYER